jgi:hypothetical protein
MYSLYPNLTTCFFVRVDQCNFPLPDVEILSTDTDFSPEVPAPCASESNSRRCDSSLCVSESDTFFFPFSLRVNRLVGFLRGECTAESPLFAGSSSDWSNRPSPILGPLSGTEIRLSGRVPFSGSSGGISTSLTSPSELGLESGYGMQGKYQDVDSSTTTSRLTHACLVRGF